MLEGRSLHCIAVYQSLILNPEDDQRAYDEMRAILGLATLWRPLPDLTFLITDNVTAATERSERRDGITFSHENRQFHHRVAALFDRLADDASRTVTVIDRRHLSSGDAVSLMRARIDERQRALSCMARGSLPHPAESLPCTTGCCLTGNRVRQTQSPACPEAADRADVKAPPQP